MVQSASSYLTLPSRDTLRKRQTPVSKSNFKQSDIHKEVLNIKKKFDRSLAQVKDNFYTPIHWGVFEKIKVNQLLFFEEQYFRSLADEGDPIAAYMYGTMKFLGVGVQKNEEEGYGYLLLAKQSGSKLATIALKSYKEAFAKFSTGAELCLSLSSLFKNL